MGALMTDAAQGSSRGRLRLSVLVCVLAAAATLGAAGAAQAAPTVTEFTDGITQYMDPFYGPTYPGTLGITAGPDGNVWFTEPFAGRVGRITPSGTITEFSEGISPYTNEYGITQTPGPQGIASGPDGNVWFTEQRADRVARITPSGAVTEFSAGITAGSGPGAIAPGPDGNLWFTEGGVNQVARITPAGVVTEFPTGGTQDYPADIAAGPDGNLWFTEPDSEQIGRITPSGTITQFPDGPADNSRPTQIAAGPDGNMWFTTDGQGSSVARITPSGEVTGFSEGFTGSTGAMGIAAGPDGNMWFTEYIGGADFAVGRITPSGTVSEFTEGISAGSAPEEITAGPDGNMWFSELDLPQVGRITTDAAPAPVVSTGPASALDTTSATLSGSVNPAGSPVSAHFEYGTDTGYGSSTPVQAVSGEAPVAVTASLSGLSPGTTYHYRLVAANALQTNAGGDQTFTTTTSPAAETPPVNPPAGPVPTPPGPTATADTSAPSISGLGLTRNPFVVGGARTPISAVTTSTKHRKGTTLKYSLSEAATVRIVIARRRAGRRSGARCVAATRKLRRAKRCTRFSTNGTLTRASHQGANRVAFSGRISSKALRAGRYRARMIATDAAMNSSAPKTITFTVVRR